MELPKTTAALANVLADRVHEGVITAPQAVRLLGHAVMTAAGHDICDRTQRGRYDKALQRAVRGESIESFRSTT